MGRKSTKENKTIYQRYREQNDLTREKAAELLDTVSEDGSSGLKTRNCFLTRRT